jgi:hypothetical protein
VTRGSKVVQYSSSVVDVVFGEKTRGWWCVVGFGAVRVNVKSSRQRKSSSSVVAMREEQKKGAASKRDADGRRSMGGCSRCEGSSTQVVQGEKGRSKESIDSCLFRSKFPRCFPRLSNDAANSGPKLDPGRNSSKTQNGDPPRRWKEKDKAAIEQQQQQDARRNCWDKQARSVAKLDPWLVGRMMMGIQRWRSSVDPSLRLML